ncbi:Na+/H+ antiporter NhaA [Rhizobium leguminosarum]|uniref:Na(+)/H(+) antiporter NhaA n=1 Tax=Rhizobium leguminosarum TaxID=384 RepID=A0A4Q8XYL1_RHILE|nr:Na+/H+ antiporter NhaA [Rhizobium leguminosarum]TAX72000.1 Na+/H+ antiporter NhaA [Rhizobium leguminosarum]
MSNTVQGRIRSTLRQFLDSEASGGLILMAVAALAIVVANSSVADFYFHTLHVYLGPLSLQHWINDALMSIFFLLVGLEIKREMLDGQLSSWGRRILPGAAAAGGMALPALIYIGFNLVDPSNLRGWAIPTATDIAFALGVLSLLGNRVPASLKIFLAALAIIDDLGAVIVIAAFYTANINFIALAAAAVVIGNLVILNRSGVKNIWIYLGLGVLLWIAVFMSGIHATLAGVVLALAVPLKLTPGAPEASDDDSPLHRLEHALQKPVAFFIVPLFGFANAGVSFAGTSTSVLIEPVTIGIAAGLLFGKLAGVLGTVTLLVKTGLAPLPARASWAQMTGVSLLCGIGFTMSLFIGLLAFPNSSSQDHVKIGILAGSLASGLAGAALLMGSARRRPASKP